MTAKGISARPESTSRAEEESSGQDLQHHPKSISFKTIWQICSDCQPWNSKLNPCASIHSSLLPNKKKKHEGKTSNGLQREFVSRVVESRGVIDVTAVGTQRDRTGDTGRVTHQHYCQHTDSAWHWSEQIAINLGLRYKYTQICTVHIQEKSFAFVTWVTLAILESRYRHQGFARWFYWNNEANNFH